MKKIIMTLTLSWVMLNIYSQQPATKEQLMGSSGNAKSSELIINGMPYSQYKTEQEALKQTKANQVAAAKVATTNLSNADVTKTAMAESPTRPAVKEVNQVSDDQREAAKAKPQVVSTQPVKTSTSPENKVVPSAAKNSSADPDAKPVAPAKQNTAAAVVPAQNSGNTAPATEKSATKD